MQKRYKVGDRCRKGHLLTRHTLYSRPNNKSKRCKLCRALYIEENKEKLRKKYKQRYRKNRSSLLKLSHERYIKNRSRVIRWLKRNPDKVRAAWLRRYNLTLEQYQDVLKKQNGACW